MRGITNVRKYKGARKFSNIIKNRRKRESCKHNVPPRKLEVYENFNNNEKEEEEKNRGYPFPSSLFIFPVWPRVEDPPVIPLPSSVYTTRARWRSFSSSPIEEHSVYLGVRHSFPRYGENRKGTSPFRGDLFSTSSRISRFETEDLSDFPPIFPWKEK